MDRAVRDVLAEYEARSEVFQTYVRDSLDLDSLLLPVGSGIELSRKRESVSA
jgi:hypothetical protein